jgi:hypothetical protein
MNLNTTRPRYHNPMVSLHQPGHLPYPHRLPINATNLHTQLPKDPPHLSEKEGILVQEHPVSTRTNEISEEACCSGVLLGSRTRPRYQPPNARASTVHGSYIRFATAYQANNSTPDSKQARDLVGVLREAKQYIDPKLEEMTH